jgi:aspartate beta-hydroxylase
MPRWPQKAWSIVKTDPTKTNSRNSETKSKKKRGPFETFLKWGPWNYRFWREIYRGCYEHFLRNPAVVSIEEHFPESHELLTNYSQIREEVLKVALSGRLPANHEIMQQQRTLYEFDKKAWGMLPLRGYGFNYPDNQRLIPSLKKFLVANPRVVSAAVSLFPPGKVLRPHKGPFKGVWRCHLGLYIKELKKCKTSCELNIDGITYYLKEGDMLLWDDTFIHSATNPSTEPRVVLLFDVLRRDQPWPLLGLSWIFLWAAQLWQRCQNMRQRALYRSPA